MAEKGTLFGKPRDEVVKKPGALRAELHVKAGQKIPEGKLEKAAHAGGKLGKRARLAETFSKMRKG